MPATEVFRLGRPLTGVHSSAKPASLRGHEDNANGSRVADKRDHDRFSEVFLPHLVDAYRLARWLVGSRTDAEDVVQEAAMRALKGIAGYNGVNSRAWVLTVVRNTAYTWMARNRPAGVVLSGDLGSSEDETAAAVAPGATAVANPEEILIAKGEIEDMRRHVAALPAPFREVLVLREIHELGYREIAQIAAIPIGTVMSRLARARRLLIDSMRGAP
jgi:RNA polymerase sigma factor (sigma-70 family)